MTTLTLSRTVIDFAPLRALRGIGRLFGSIAAAQRATNDFERMNNRTDAQLAAAGLRREDVARVVLERYFD